ncbi:hypothetical protein AM629_10560 [Photorhabdus heterorhabditis]|uniref:Uncharacterized protein n=1 Tax=Photorhabdus heterorhabditis TaxID=880156 RepID=A0ABR5KCB8_9GAMM|nr:hypothetical protein AM629_10560 [Photorhabdus heterorhabditis]
MFASGRFGQTAHFYLARGLQPLFLLMIIETLFIFLNYLSALAVFVFHYYVAALLHKIGDFKGKPPDEMCFLFIRNRHFLGVHRNGA